MLMTRPPSGSSGRAACVTNATPLRSVSTTVSQASSSSEARSVGIFVPALLTRMSIVPHPRVSASKHTRIDAALRTSSPSATERRPFVRISRATGSASPAFRDVIATSAPALARATAIARPMPRLPPVTSERLPCRSNGPPIQRGRIRSMRTVEAEIRAPGNEAFPDVLTPDALDFLGRLHREVEPTRVERLASRAEVAERLRSGGRFHFLGETADVRQKDWRVADVPKDLRVRKVEITGPTDRKMVINALNSGASVYMADFEDANTPTWHNMVEGQRNLIDAVERRISFKNPDGREYKLNDEIATLVVRPRGWHLVERHLLIDGVPISGAVFDFGLYVFHNARRLLERGSGPYFYLPKMESHREARLWNDIFNWTEDELDLGRGKIKATVLVEVLPLAFEMEETLYELRDHRAGLNAGRWDYMFSIIKKLGDRKQFILPDRGQVAMTVPFMRAYTELLVKTCHKRGAFALGGMAAVIPNRRYPGVTVTAVAKVGADKKREATDGFDGTWVAHPDLVETAMSEFDRALGKQLNQLDRQRPEVAVTAEQLLDVRIPGGTITDAGLRTNVSVGIQYIASWLRGTGAAAINNLMEDAATAEISRSQVWQWIHHGVSLKEGPQVTAKLVQDIEHEELAKIKSAVGDDFFAKGRYDEAREIFDGVALQRISRSSSRSPRMNGSTSSPAQLRSPNYLRGR